MDHQNQVLSFLPSESCSLHTSSFLILVVFFDQTPFFLSQKQRKQGIEMHLRCVENKEQGRQDERRLLTTIMYGLELVIMETFGSIFSTNLIHFAFDLTQAFTRLFPFVFIAQVQVNGSFWSFTR